MNHRSDEHDKNNLNPSVNSNKNTYFTGPNPITSFTPASIGPSIDSSAYVGPYSVIIGDVTVGKNVFIAPLVSIRADEGFPFFIDSDTNIQDGAVLHGLEHGRVVHGGKEYSIYIGKHVSCAHGCIIHGPCKIEDHVFVGFHAIVHDAVVGAGCYISFNALVTGGVTVPPNRFVPSGAIIDTQAKADRLEAVSEKQRVFAEEVQHVNRAFPGAHAKMYDSSKSDESGSEDPN
jgi:carbonic anhydrase/acetyltransferase-like protein (isoleucine patch superfamily)